MPSDETTRQLEAAAAVLELDIRPEWMPNVVRFFAVATSMAALVIASGVLTEAESAPVFTARESE